MNLYLVVRRLCDEKGTNVNQLEKALGFSHRSISRWDKSSPSIESVKKVADYFGVTVDYLLNMDDEEEIKTLYSSYNALNKENRALVDSLLDRLLKMQ